METNLELVENSIHRSHAKKHVKNCLHLGSYNSSAYALYW